MKTIKHIGKIKNTGSKVIIVFRCLPGDTGNALVLPTATVPDAYHDALIQLVDSDQGQDAYEFGEIMFIRHFPDGRLMLTAMQQDGRLHKVPTSNILVTPTAGHEIPLSELNALIAEQKGIALDELPALTSGSPKAKSESPVPVTEPEAAVVNNEPAVLSDSDLAKSFRSQADSMYKEAAKLRKQADDLDPPVKKPVKVKQSADA
jgi:hypothetical protein